MSEESLRTDFCDFWFSFDSTRISQGACDGVLGKLKFGPCEMQDIQWILRWSQSASSDVVVQGKDNRAETHGPLRMGRVGLFAS
jgi:hypothetical protein